MNSDSPGEAPAKKRERLFDHHMWWIILLAIGGVFVYQTFKYQAFPAASIDIKKPRLEIQDEALLLAPKLGYSKKDLIESTIFENDDSAKTFLEHEYTQEQANKLMATEIPIWYWKTSLCKEFDQEDFTSWISPQGKLVSFDRDVPNDAAMPSVSHEEARKIARAYIEANDPDAGKFTKLISDESSSKTKREDHSYTWEDPETDYKTAHLRVYVYVSGDKITKYNKFLHVPDKWEREFDTMRSYNTLLGQFAFFFIYLFQTVAFLIFVWGIITKNIRWRAAIFGGILLGGISALDYLNHLPALITNYTPTIAFRDYIINVVFKAVMGFVGNAMMGVSLFGGSEIVYRKLFPHKIAFEKMLTVGGVTNEKFVRAVIVGHFVVAIHLGWIVLYYIAGKQMNFWCPLGVESHEVLSNVIPFVSAIALGVTASFEEELACRIIGIGIGTRLFKNFWIANLFQAVVWGFAHSSYPQEPAYARGLELTMVGLLQGWILRRYGIVACVSSHYLVDSFMYVEAFLYSDVTALKLSVIPALIPWLVLVAVAFAVKKKKELGTSDEYDNDKIPLIIPPPPPVEDAPPPIDYHPLARRVRVSMAIICLLGIISLIIFPIKGGINQDAKLLVSHSEALTRARAVMEKHNIDPKDWMQTATSSTNSIGESFQYIFENTDAETTRNIFKETRRGFYWAVRFFKPLVSEQYTVYLDGAGNETTLDITREEDDPGASLTEEEARKTAEDYLRETHPEFKDFKFKKTSTDKRKNRIDYTVEFTYPRLKVAEADCRISVDVIGGQVGNFQQFWDVPDSWTFEREKRTSKDVILGHVRTFGSILFALGFLLWCYSVLRTGAIRYRIPIIIALATLPLGLLAYLNDLPSFFTGLSTTTPMSSYIAEQLLGLASSLFGKFVSISVLIAVTLGALRIIAPRTPIVSYLKYTFGKTNSELPNHRDGRMELWFDAILFSYASISFTVITNQLKDMIAKLISPSVPVDSIYSITELTDVYVPIAYVAIKCLEGLPMTLCAIVAAVGLAGKFAPTFGRIALIGLVATLVACSGERYWQDYVLEVAQSLSMGLFLYVAIAQLGRSSYVAYALSAVMVTCLGYVATIAYNGPQLFLPEFIALATIVILPAFILFALLIKLRKQSADAAKL
ncbi:MAG: type II CAAX endopeptidase family protein [Candidatus Melainabacteria bacterium]|nr:type II CAAX endopeptidase family protein [Candidatus Melainabacteria bacterium]